MKRILSALCLCVSAHLIGNEIDSWSSPPTTISSGGVDASDPHIGMATSGDIVAAWLENGLVVSRSKPLSNPWDTLATLSGNGATSPQLAVDPSGNATAIWVEGGAVKTANKPSAGSWSSATSLSASSSSAPQIAVRSNGDLVAVWVEGGVIKSSTQLFGGSWSAADTLSASGADSPQVAIGDNGDVFAVWHAQNGISLIETIYTATKAIAGSWSAAATISDANTNSVIPQIAVDPNGNATAIWFSYNLSGSDYTNVKVQSAAYSATSFSWSSPVALSEAGKKNPASLQLQVLYNNTGLPVVAWSNSFDGATFQVDTTQRDNAGTWSQPFTLATSLYAYTIDMAVSPVGDLFVVYMNYDPGSSSVVIQTRESHIGGVGAGGWTGPVLLSTGTSNAFPEITAVVTGGTDSNAASAWLSFDGSNNLLQAVTGTGTLVIPPSTPAVVQNVNSFGVFNEYFNTVTWSASTDPNLAGYIVYRGNDILTFVDSGTLSYVDNNQVQNGTVTYGVSAIDNNGTESAVITVTFP
ncbi:MAG: hypothetical protein JSR57_06570 [Verrucomicrobia bacterium]|nr:hypothetical protein [Verrucomicrobiota bacterium]